MKNLLLFQSTITQMDSSKNTAKVIVGSKTSLSLNKDKGMVFNCKRKVANIACVFCKARVIFFRVHADFFMRV